MRGHIIKIINNIPITSYDNRKLVNGQLQHHLEYAAWEPLNRLNALAVATDIRPLELYCKQQSLYQSLDDYLFGNVVDLAVYMKPYLKKNVQFEDVYLTLWVNMTYKHEVNHHNGNKTLHFYGFALSQFNKAPGLMDLKLVHCTTEIKDGEQICKNKCTEMTDIPISISSFRQHCHKLITENVY